MRISPTPIQLLSPTFSSSLINLAKWNFVSLRRAFPPGSSLSFPTSFHPFPLPSLLHLSSFLLLYLPFHFLLIYPHPPPPLPHHPSIFRRSLDSSPWGLFSPSSSILPLSMAFHLSPNPILSPPPICSPSFLSPPFFGHNS